MDVAPAGIIASVADGLREHVRQSAVRGLLRAAYHSIVARRGVEQSIDGRSLRFEHGAAPPTAAMAALDPVAELDRLCLEKLMEVIRPGDEVADVGGWRGTYTLMAAQRAGSGGHVTVFEPAPESRRRIERVVRWNGVRDRVTIRPYAVCDVDGTVAFFACGGDPTHGIFGEFTHSAAKDGSARSVRVPSVTLDGYYGAAAADGVRRPDVVKIDVEGAEFAVLRGAEGILASAATVLCELHPYASLRMGRGRTHGRRPRELAGRARPRADGPAHERADGSRRGRALRAGAAHAAGADRVVGCRAEHPGARAAARVVPRMPSPSSEP
jgi:FkbM family methyltransferase